MVWKDWRTYLPLLERVQYAAGETVTQGATHTHGLLLTCLSSGILYMIELQVAGIHYRASSCGFRVHGAG